MDVCCRLFDRTYGRVRNQIRGEVAVECRERSRFGGREPEADVAIGADHDHAARRDAGADGIDARGCERSARAWTSVGPAARATRRLRRVQKRARGATSHRTASSRGSAARDAAPRCLPRSLRGRRRAGSPRSRRRSWRARCAAARPRSGPRPRRASRGPAGRRPRCR